MCLRDILQILVILGWLYVFKDILSRSNPIQLLLVGAFSRRIRVAFWGVHQRRLWRTRQYRLLLHSLYGCLISFLRWELLVLRVNYASRRRWMRARLRRVYWEADYHIRVLYWRIQVLCWWASYLSILLRIRCQRILWLGLHLANRIHLTQILLLLLLDWQRLDF